MNYLYLILTVFLSFHISAVDTYFCTDDFQNLPTLQRGRVKPLYVHSQEVIKMLTGKTTINGISSTIAFCLTSLRSTGMKINLELMAPIEHEKLKKYFNLAKGTSSIRYEDLTSQFQSIRMESFRQKDKGSYKKSLDKLLNQITLYQSISSGQNWQFAALDSNNQIIWQNFLTYLTEDKIISAKANSAHPFQSIINQSKVNYDNNTKEKKYLIELLFAKMHLPLIALILTLLSLASGVLFKKFPITLVISTSTMMVQIVYLSFRIYISGRAPITNMYETVLFSGLGGLILAMGIGHFKKEKVFVFVGLAYNTCTLFMINFAHGMLDPGINPLVPVLRDNFWLSTHVTTIILSYGALALSWILANATMIRKKLTSMTSAEESYYAELIYTCLKFGTILLAAGIILGGVWADYSWGRFWGWDPKETWSLIVLCLYMAILHGKYTTWISKSKFIPLVAVAFLSVMMAWFGVNYILATGLHSYGFSQGGAIFLSVFFIVQIIVLAFTQLNFFIQKTQAENI